VFIVDAHQNIGYNAHQIGRDYTQWAWHQRQQELGLNLRSPMTSLPDNMLGRVGIVFASLLVIPEASPTKQPWEHVVYKNSRQAYEQAMWQMDYYKRLEDESPKVKLIRTQSDLDIVVQSWDVDKEVADHIQGLVILMEGADPILEPKQLEEWVEQGVRIVAPAWQQTRYATGAGFDGELTMLGYELLDVMANYNTMLDVSHMSERAYKQAVEMYSGSIIASHANPRYFHDSPHCLSDDMIRRLAERDGVMGIMLYNRYLRKNWHHTDPKHNVSLSHVADVIDYVCQLTGSTAHVGIGSDIDGGYAYRSVPEEIDSSSDLWGLKDCLLARGFSDDDVQAILGGNMLRKLRQTLPN
jgi:membrane dipeptidase